MALGFSDIDEEYEYESEMYDSGCSMIGTSDDKEYVEEESRKHDESTSILGVHS
jgi:hypothetical protein